MNAIAKPRTIEREPEYLSPKARMMQFEQYAAVVGKPNGKLTEANNVAFNSVLEYDHYVYIMTAGASPLIKIGYTKDLKRRRSEIQGANGKPVMVLWAIRLKKENAVAVESGVHYQLKASFYHRIGEWYDMSPETGKVAILREIEKRRFKFMQYRDDIFTEFDL